MWSIFELIDTKGKSDDNDSYTNSDYCAICMDKQNPHDASLLRCGHTFCTECVDTLVEYAKIKTYAKCPLCRERLVKCWRLDQV